MTARAAFLLLLAALVCAAPAQGAGRKHAPTVNHRHAARRHRRAFHFSAEMRDGGGSPGKSYAARTPGAPHLRPSLDTRIGKRGVTASFGYHPGVIAPTLGPHELNGAAEPRLGHSESSAGVSVKVPL